MSSTPIDLLGKLSEVRRQIQSHCQSLVDAGMAQWSINDNGDTELHMNSGETYLFGDLGVTRLT